MTAAQLELGHLDIQGLWWLPENPDRKVAGRFVWDPVNGGTLSLVGRLRPRVLEDVVGPDGKTFKAYTGTNRAEQYARVLGQQETLPVTLIDCFMKSSGNLSMGDDAHEMIVVNRALTGSAWHDETALDADRLTALIRHMTMWVGHTGIVRDYKWGDSDIYVETQVKRLAPLASVIGETAVELVQYLWPTGDGHNDAGIRQEWRVRCSTTTPVPVDDLIQRASDVQDLVTFAMGRPASFGEIEISHPDYEQKRPDGKTRRLDPSKYYAQWSSRSPDDSLVKSHELMFTYDDFGGAEGLTRWLATAEKFRSELGRVAATRYGRDVYLEDRIANVCAALEGFDMVRRRLKSDKVLKTHLTQSAIFAGRPFADLVVEDVDAWVAKVVDARHDIAHHREPMRNGSPSLTVLLSEQIFWLFVMCMLREAQAPDEVWTSLSRHNETSWLIRQAKEAIASGVPAV